MNANQIINMIMRIVMRKAINGGINAGVKHFSRGKPDKHPGKDTPETGHDAARRAQKAMRVTRRIGKF